MPNSYTIYYSPQFVRELRHIYNYLYSLISPQTADRLLEKVKHFISRLDLFPERYSQVSFYSINSPIHNLRKMPVDNYIIIYEVDKCNNQVFILHIFHGSQNYLSQL